MIIGLTEDFFHKQGMGGQVIILRLHHLYDFRHETNGNIQNHHVPSCYDVHVMPCPIFSSTALNINKPFPYALTRTDIIINIIININKASQHDTTRQGLLAPNSSESWPKTNTPCFSSYAKFMPNSFLISSYPFNSSSSSTISFWYISSSSLLPPPSSLLPFFKLSLLLMWKYSYTLKTTMDNNNNKNHSQSQLPHCSAKPKSTKSWDVSKGSKYGTLHAHEKDGDYHPGPMYVCRHTYTNFLLFDFVSSHNHLQLVPLLYSKWKMTKTHDFSLDLINHLTCRPPYSAIKQASSVKYLSPHLVSSHFISTLREEMQDDIRRERPKTCRTKTDHRPSNRAVLTSAMNVKSSSRLL